MVPEWDDSDVPWDEIEEAWRMFWCMACRRASPFTVLVKAPALEVFTNGYWILELCQGCFDDEDRDWLELKER